MTHDIDLLPDCRSDAFAAGYSHYYTGKPCSHGHVDVRTTKGGTCLACMRMRQKQRQARDSDYRDLHRKSCRERMRKVLADPLRRKAIREREGQLHRASEDRKFNKALADAIRNQRPEVKAKARLHQNARYHAKLADDPVHIEARKKRGAEWARNNKDRCNAKTALRRTLRMKASPPWLTDGDMLEIQSFYNEAQRRFEATNLRHDVDHIVPLSHPLVCGLHVPWNLQVLTSTQNRAKRNKFGEDECHPI